MDASQNQKGKQTFCGIVLGWPRDVGYFMRSFSMIVRSKMKTVDRFNILKQAVTKSSPWFQTVESSAHKMTTLPFECCLVISFAYIHPLDPFRESL